MLDQTIKESIARLGLEEKVKLLSGESAFRLHDAPGIGLQSIVFSDGPAGVRGEKFVGGEKVALLPNPTLIGASFDDEAAATAGRILAEEASRQGVHVVLAPTINLHRSPLGGRLFEAFSEDPYLTGRTATHYVRAMQALGISACPKHLAANESETLRNFVDIQVDEATLRSLYLLPFMMVVEDAAPWSMMSAYNDINGVAASEHPQVQQAIPRDEWQWDGLMISDWFATKSTASSANNGLDLVMPGPNGPWEDRLLKAVENGLVEETTINLHVERLLKLAARVGAFTCDEPVPAVNRSVLADEPGRRQQLIELAARGAVVLKNQDVLPLLETQAITLVGRHALNSLLMGGGSARVDAAFEVSIAEGVGQRWKTPVTIHDGVEIDERPSAAIDGLLHDPVTGRAGIHVTLFNAQGETIDHWHNDGAEFQVDPRVMTQFPARIHVEAILGEAAVGVNGLAKLGMIGPGRWTLSVGEETRSVTLAFDGNDPGEANIKPPAYAGEWKIQTGSRLDAWLDVEPIDWEARLLGDPALKMKPESHLLQMEQIGRLGIVAAPMPVSDEEIIAELRRTCAQQCVVVVVGTNAEREAESSDKTTLSLPGMQDAMVEAIADVARTVIVVVNAATPVLMPWLDRVNAVLVVGLPGQEGGHAVAAMLSGELEPSGRLPTSWPAADGQASGWNVVPDDDLTLDYAEGTFIGYRGYHAGHAPAPAFWFGYGLGYGQWLYGEPQVVSGDIDAAVDQPAQWLTLSVPVTNTSSHRSRETVQLYFEPALKNEPVRLVGYDTRVLAAGETGDIRVSCDPRLCRQWTQDEGWQSLKAGRLLIARGLGDIRATLELQTPECQARRQSL